MLVFRSVPQLQYHLHHYNILLGSSQAAKPPNGKAFDHEINNSIAFDHEANTKTNTNSNIEADMQTNTNSIIKAKEIEVVGYRVAFQVFYWLAK